MKTPRNLGRKGSSVTAVRRSRRAFSLAKSLGLGLGLATAVFPKHDAQADTTWVGGISQDWGNAANWSNGLPATGNGVTFINTATGNYPIYSAADGTSQSGNDIIIGTGASGRLDETGGTLSTGSGNWLIIGQNSGGTGTFNLSGGIFNASEVHLGSTSSGTASGTVAVSGSGTLNASGWLTLADSNGAGNASSGTLNVSGGTVNVGGHLVVASAGNAGGTISLTGGTINVGSATNTEAVNVNRYDTTKGQLNVNGGTLNLFGGSVVFGSDSGTGVSSVNLSSGTITGTAGSSLNFMATNVAGNNTVNLDGGTLTLNQIISTYATGTRVFNFNGGTLQAAAASTTFFAATRASAANVRNGGAVINSNGFDITIGQVLQHSAVSGDNAKDGGLTKNGVGTLTLTGYSTFTGDVTLNAGAIAGGADIGNVYTNSILGNLSDTLATARNINVGSGTTLSLTSGNVFGTGGSTNTLSQVALNVTGGTFQTGSQTSTGGFWNKVGALNLNGATVNVGTGANNAGFQGLALIGTVTVSGATASTINNFAGSTAGSNGIHLGQNATAGQSITFNVADVTGDANPDLTVAPSLLNTSNSLTASGLTKTGAGTLLLTGVEAYTGGTTISAGTLQIGNGNAASLGGGTYAGAISNAGTLVFNSTAAQSLTGNLTGGGALTKAGSGALTISGTDALGGVTVMAGTLNVQGTTTAGVTTVAGGSTLGLREVAPATATLTGTTLSFGTGTSALALNFNALGNPTAGFGNLSGVLTLNGTVSISLSNFGGLTSATNIPLLTYASQGGTGVFSLATASSGHTNFALNDTATALYLSVSAITNKWTGATNNVWDINTTSNWSAPDQKYLEGDIVLFDDTGSNTNPVSLGVTVNPASVTFNNSAKTYTISGSGSIAGSGTLIKNGSGLVALNTANTYTGGTTINAGTLAINTNTSLGDAAGALTLNGGTLETTANITTARNITLGNANGTILADVGTTYTVNGVVSGSGALTTSGAGTLTLTGTNTYTGGTNINAGVVSVGADANLGTSASGITLNGGTLSTTAGITDTHAITVGAAGGTINVTTNGQFFMNTANTLLGSGPLTLTGAGTLTAGVGNLRIAQTNTYNGNLTVQSGGIVEYGVLGAVDAAATFTLGNQGEVALQGAPATTMPNGITVSGGTNSVLSFENGNLGVYGGNIAATANLTVGLRDWYNNATVRSGTISGVISGGGSLTVNSGTGSGGLLTLSGANTYTGGTTISAAQVQAGTSTALGTGAVTVGGTAAEVQLASGVNVANALTINTGAGVAVQGIVYVPTGSATYSGPITINAAATSGGHFAANGGVLTLSGAITSSVPVQTRLGTIVFSNTGNSFTQLNAQAGTVTLGTTNAIPVAASVDLGASGAAVLDLAGFNQTLAGITKNTNGATVTNSGATNSTLTTTGTATFGGVIQDGATNKVALAVSSGALTLTGANTFSGNATVTGGTLAAGTNSTPSAAGSTITSGPLGIGTINLNGGTVASGANAYATLTVANPVVVQAGGGSIVGTVNSLFVENGNVTGSGALGLSATYNGSGLALGGNNAGYTGTVTVTGANVRLQSANSGSAAAAWVLNGNLQTDTAGTNTYNLGSLSGTGSISSHGTNTASTMSVGALNTSTTFSGIIVDNAGDNATTGNADGGSGNVLSLTKVGTGTLALTGANTYSGPTTVNAGSLLVNGTNSGAGAVSVNAGRLGGTGTVAGAVTVASGATLLGGDGVTAGGALTLNATPTLNSGSLLELVLGAGGAHSTLALAAGGFNGFNTNQAFTLDNVQAGTYDNVITGVASGIATSGWTVTNGSGFSYSFSDDGSNIDLTVTAVPEPATWVAGLLTVGLMGSTLRRRAQAWLRLPRVG